MSLADYTDLQGQIGNWMANSGLSGQAADFITLAEATLNRELGAVEVDQALTGIALSNAIDISAYAVVEPIALFVAQSGSDEVLLLPQSEGSFPVSATSGFPAYWSIDGTSINFDCPLDQAYNFRFRYRQRFALSDTAPTNWLLTNHPDVYLAAVLVWSGMYKRNQDIPANMSAVLSTGIPAVKRELAQKRRGTLRIDPALLRSGRLSYQQWANWP